MKHDHRHPWTNAYDFIRFLAGYNNQGTKLSRDDASNILNGIVEVTKWDKKNLAIALSNHYLENRSEITKKGVSDAIRQLMNDNTITNDAS